MTTPVYVQSLVAPVGLPTAVATPGPLGWFQPLSLPPSLIGATKVNVGRSDWLVYNPSPPAKVPANQWWHQPLSVPPVRGSAANAGNSIWHVFPPSTAPPLSFGWFREFVSPPVQSVKPNVGRADWLSPTPPFATAIDFRSTATYVVDPPYATYCLGDIYPTTRAGLTFGWSSAATVSNGSTSVDPRLAGMNSAPSGFSDTFTVNLPNGPGVYAVTIAAGWASIASAVDLELFDGATQITRITGSAGGDQFFDATGVLYSAAQWPSQNSPILYNFAGSTLTIVDNPTAAGSFHTIAHLALTYLGPSGFAVLNSWLEPFQPTIPRTQPNPGDSVFLPLQPFAPAASTPSWGWLTPLSEVAPHARTVLDPANWLVYNPSPPSPVPYVQWWHQPLSIGPVATKAPIERGAWMVPFVPAANPTPSSFWFQPLSEGPPHAVQRNTGDAAWLVYNPSPPVPTPTSFWFQPLSIAPVTVKANSGAAAWMVTVPAAPPAPSFGYYQPLSVGPPRTQANPGDSLFYIERNIAVPAAPPFGWFAPLSVSAPFTRMTWLGQYQWGLPLPSAPVFYTSEDYRLVSFAYTYAIVGFANRTGLVTDQ